MKKIRLRKWVKVVLTIIASVSCFLMVCGCDSLKVMFIKTLFTIPVFVLSVLTLKIYE